VSQSPARSQLLEEVARRVPAGVPSAGRVRVAIDGVDGAGKTTFADELARVLAATGRPVIRASVDSFHHVRARRYGRGRDSWEGFWLDSFDYQRLYTDLLEPFGPAGSGRYRPAAHDLASDQLINVPWLQAPNPAVLILDGLFLHREELVELWDLSVFLDVPFEVSAARMATRDGTDPDPASPSLQRYVKAQRHYLASCSPRQRATLLVSNTDLKRPLLLA
jgi:uridine kinase